MRLTLHTDYALRVLIFAALKGDTLSTINEIAQHFDISRAHLMKVVHRLGLKGYLETVRGKNGGLRLARKPSLINVGTVVRDMEDELSVLDCLREEGYCRIEQNCVLRGALRDATNAFLTILDRYTLEDLVRPHQFLTQALAISPPPARRTRSRSGLLRNVG
jgi:Rrf2 family nitric oxide-sensitive transcriptional repressor